MEYSGHPDQYFGHLTFSQHGEDVLIANLFKLIGIEKPTFLDLGAHHPVNISNTYLLYNRGSRGINIEANPNMIALFSFYRPEDITVNCGVTPFSSNSTLTYYMYDDTSGRNTFSIKEAATVKNFDTSKNIPVLMKNINDIVEEYCNGSWPDFLSTDLEGMDFDILMAANFTQTKPKIICSEVRRGEFAAFNSLMTHEGYFCHSRMGENLIFVQNELHTMVF